MVLVLGLAPVLLIVALAFSVNRAAPGETSPRAAQAIVVLGARVLPNGEAAPALQRRAERAVALYRQGLAPLVIFSGGSNANQPSEAGIARDLAVALGVPAEVCVVEEQSRTTAQNADLTVPLLTARGITEVLLVSDGYHLKRARAHFTRLGVSSQPVASGRVLATSGRAYLTLREVAALLRRPWLLWARLPAEEERLQSKKS